GFLVDMDSEISASACVVAENKDHGVWLIESFQRAPMRRFSGTLEVNRGKTRADLTVAAFVHLAFLASQETMLLADIEGWLLPEGVKIFDPMIHSTRGTFGLGDQGTKAIDDFRINHKCNTFCVHLGLESLSPSNPNNELVDDCSEDTNVDGRTLPDNSHHGLDTDVEETEKSKRHPRFKRQKKGKKRARSLFEEEEDDPIEIPSEEGSRRRFLTRKAAQAISKK
ncbi:hypothetical protein TREMEDRAFT_34670, partial [Tremella mesenterica DSM 1558]|uniref:uncharacterized protein n=1 Tax=Tremella mesenterica (strain ATCC 24925 / CBS 8224 / DSM 1558 / NBRC 9311 / NRRL Y-6157 / RJB 2259-6 / UBC 559-6) TaxID=578456 RepID=UPI00032C3740